MLSFNTFPYAIAAVIATLWLLSRSTSSPKGLAKTSELLRFSGWLIPASPLYILLQRVDLIILSRYGSYRVLGLYGAAVVLSSVVSLFTSNLQVIFLPKAAESFSRAEGLHDYFFQAFAASSAIAVVAVVGAVTAPWILRTALGAGYVSAALPLRVLFLGYVVVAMTPPLTALLYAAGRTKLIFGERLLELAVALTLCLILVPRYAATGAATSISLAYLVGGLYVLVNVRRVMREPAPRTEESVVSS
jgi:O-antigen/teichoic acid export membrane protein